MKSYLRVLPLVLLFASCSNSKTREELKNEIIQTEKAFEQMTFEKGISQAFYYYAAENAVIKRENDSLITGKENIRSYYEKKNMNVTNLNWTPEFIEVSASGDLGYTYGKYQMRIKNEDDETTEYQGIFHTIWKRQKDNSWKYVWD